MTQIAFIQHGATPGYVNIRYEGDNIVVTVREASDGSNTGKCVSLTLCRADYLLWAEEIAKDYARHATC
jgi:hypothetical protein